MLSLADVVCVVEIVDVAVTEPEVVAVVVSVPVGEVVIVLDAVDDADTVAVVEAVEVPDCVSVDEIDVEAVDVSVALNVDVAEDVADDCAVVETVLLIDVRRQPLNVPERYRSIPSLIRETVSRQLVVERLATR
jgi:hypothetical protein